MDRFVVAHTEETLLVGDMGASKFESSEIQVIFVRHSDMERQVTNEKVKKNLIGVRVQPPPRVSQLDGETAPPPRAHPES